MILGEHSLFCMSRLLKVWKAPVFFFPEKFNNLFTTLCFKWALPGSKIQSCTKKAKLWHIWENSKYFYVMSQGKAWSVEERESLENFMHSMVRRLVPKPSRPQDKVSHWTSAPSVADQNRCRHVHKPEKWCAVRSRCLEMRDWQWVTESQCGLAPCASASYPIPLKI